MQESDYARWVEQLADQEGVAYAEALRDIERRLFFAHLSRHVASLKYLERILIQCLGHCEEDVRDQSIVLLNNLYDGVDWQS